MTDTFADHAHIAFSDECTCGAQIRTCQGCRDSRCYDCDPSGTSRTCDLPSDECMAGRHGRCAGCEVCDCHEIARDRADAAGIADAHGVDRVKVWDLLAHVRSSMPRLLPDGRLESDDVRIVRLAIELGWRPVVGGGSGK